ncbi:unnamed protein product, partial [Iphiclides podalirius]
MFASEFHFSSKLLELLTKGSSRRETSTPAGSSSNGKMDRAVPANGFNSAAGRNWSSVARGPPSQRSFAPVFLA